MRRSFRWRTIHHGTILRGQKRGSVAPHREHVALPTIVLQLARIRVPHWRQVSGGRGAPSTIWALDMNWEPYPPPKLRTSPIPQAVRCGQSLRRASPRKAPETQDTTEEFESQGALEIPVDERSSRRVAIAGEAMNDRASAEERRHPAYVAFIRNSRQFYTLWVPLASLAIILAISRLLMHDHLPDWVMLGYYFSIAAAMSLIFARARYGRKAR